VRASGNAYYEALFELERARALALTGEREAAASLAMAVAGKLEQIDPSDVSRSYSLLADVFRDLGEPERALELYELAAERLNHDDPHRAEVLSQLGELLEETGRTTDAMAAYKEAAQLRARTPTR
jgi:tetratricopeptide (TPR) repeat protein